MFDTTALLFLHALERGGHEQRRAASEPAARSARPTRPSSVDDRVTWMASGSLPWDAA